jgi:hypothetical protein
LRIRIDIADLKKSFFGNTHTFNLFVKSAEVVGGLEVKYDEVVPKVGLLRKNEESLANSCCDGNLSFHDKEYLICS